MKTLVIGSGGREHAIVWKLSQSPRVSKLYCAPGNGGIAQTAECVPIRVTDVTGMTDWAKENGIDFAVVASDDPLALGMVDALAAAGIPAFGPTQAAARLESSKIFAKNLMKKYNIPTAAFEAFTDCQSAVSYARTMGACPEKPLVIKADGLALGKGVLLCESVSEAEQMLSEMMEGGKFKDSGSRVVIEEYMKGREVTVLCFTDGKTLSLMPPCRDHKRAFDGDNGPNTGGMGVISPVSDFTAAWQEQAMKEIFMPTIKAMAAEGCPFRGVLYFELMLTAQGPKVIEYNARFGDPEAQTVLPLLETDLMDIFEAVTQERLSELEICWAQKASACVVLASGGYPGTYQTGFPIAGAELSPEDTVVFHAGTTLDETGNFRTAGGRVLAVTATGDTLKTALQTAYRRTEQISFEGMFYRRDIGKSK